MVHRLVARFLHFSWKEYHRYILYTHTPATPLNASGCNRTAFCYYTRYQVLHSYHNSTRYYYYWYHQYNCWLVLRISCQYQQVSFVGNTFSDILLLLSVQSSKKLKTRRKRNSEKTSQLALQLVSSSFFVWSNAFLLEMDRVGWWAGGLRWSGRVCASAQRADTARQRCTRTYPHTPRCLRTCDTEVICSTSRSGEWNGPATRRSNGADTK